MNKSSAVNLLVRSNAFAVFRFLNRNNLLILMYHRFSEAEEFGKASRSTFERHLKYLTSNYSVVSLGEVVQRIADGVPLPPRSAVITVDDGYRDFYEVALPVLRKFDLPGVIYLVTDFVDQNRWIWTDKARYVLTRTAKARLNFAVNSTLFDRELTDKNSRMLAAGMLNSELKTLPDDQKDTLIEGLANEMNVEVPDVPVAEHRALNWDEARELRNYRIEVGSHTASHPILTNVDDDRLARELSMSKAAIEEHLQVETTHFCYPNGNVSTRERQAAETAGYTSAVTTEIRLCGPRDDQFLLPRIDAEPEMHRFVKSTSGFDRLKNRPGK